eukprot:scaffold193635_cov30-Tisochrysis_lutea.AAC.4
MLRRRVGARNASPAFECATLFLTKPARRFLQAHRASLERGCKQVGVLRMLRSEAALSGSFKLRLAMPPW